MKTVCVQGVGFVGAAMAVAIASARDASGSPLYKVVAVDQDNEVGRARTSVLGRGEFPFPTSDQELLNALLTAHSIGNLSASTNEAVYEEAGVVVVDIALDIDFTSEPPCFETAGLEKAIKTIAKRVPAGALILVETTVPPGTCENILIPIINHELEQRSLSRNAVHFAHSFERVMPGENYLDSITHFWRVYAGYTPEAGDICAEFLSNIIDVKQFPLTRMSSITASETAKVLENTYRAANIAFIDEWTKFAEAVGIDLFEVLDAVRIRPTHSNIRFPGLGVGGYCLTKDPAFGIAAAKQIFGNEELRFPFSEVTLKVNQAMPFHAVDRLTVSLEGKLKGRRILILGVSYRQDVGDTRYSPVGPLVYSLIDAGAEVIAYDPLVAEWPGVKVELLDELPSASSFDVVVLAVPHKIFRELDLIGWLEESRPMVLDASNVTSTEQRDKCKNAGVRFESIGRGV